jgi:hypothetical protein
VQIALVPVLTKLPLPVVTQKTARDFPLNPFRFAKITSFSAIGFRVIAGTTYDPAGVIERVAVPVRRSDT